VMEDYARQWQAADESDRERHRQARHDAAFEHELRACALQAERDTLVRLGRDGTVSDHVLRVLRHELDLVEVSLGSRSRVSG